MLVDLKRHPADPARRLPFLPAWRCLPQLGRHRHRQNADSARWGTVTSFTVVTRFASPACRHLRSRAGAVAPDDRYLPAGPHRLGLTAAPCSAQERRQRRPLGVLELIRAEALMMLLADSLRAAGGTAICWPGVSLPGPGLGDHAIRPLDIFGPASLALFLQLASPRSCRRGRWRLNVLAGRPGTVRLPRSDQRVRSPDVPANQVDLLQRRPRRDLSSTVLQIRAAHRLTCSPARSTTAALFSTYRRSRGLSTGRSPSWRRWAPQYPGWVQVGAAGSCPVHGADRGPDLLAIFTIVLGNRSSSRCWWFLRYDDSNKAADQGPLLACSAARRTCHGASRLCCDAGRTGRSATCARRRPLLPGQETDPAEGWRRHGETTISCLDLGWGIVRSAISSSLPLYVFGGISASDGSRRDDHRRLVPLDPRLCGLHCCRRRPAPKFARPHTWRVAMN